MRYFHNLYALVTPSPRWQVAVGLDMGFQEQARDRRATHRWVNPQGVLRHVPSPQTAIAARVEYYDDPGGVIVSPTGSGFRAWGASVNLDHGIGQHALIRVEVRTLGARDPVFVQRSGCVDDGNVAFTVALALNFGP